MPHASKNGAAIPQPKGISQMRNKLVYNSKIYTKFEEDWHKNCWRLVGKFNTDRKLYVIHQTMWPLMTLNDFWRSCQLLWSVFCQNVAAW